MWHAARMSCIFYFIKVWLLEVSDVTPSNLACTICISILNMSSPLTKQPYWALTRMWSNTGIQVISKHAIAWFHWGKRGIDLVNSLDLHDARYNTSYCQAYGHWKCDQTSWESTPAPTWTVKPIVHQRSKLISPLNPAPYSSNNVYGFTQNLKVRLYLPTYIYTISQDSIQKASHNIIIEFLHFNTSIKCHDLMITLNSYIRGYAIDFQIPNNSDQYLCRPTLIHYSNTHTIHQCTFHCHQCCP